MKGLFLSLPLLLLSISGCATAPDTIDRKKQVEPVRIALRGYNGCLHENLKSCLKPEAEPKKIAETVALKCEPRLNDYKMAVREVYAEGLNPQMEDYDDLLLTKPETHANRIREKGKRATITRVLNARKSPANQAKK